MRKYTPGGFETKYEIREGSECWWWIGSVTSTGYGHLRIAQKDWKAHRYSYTIHIGPIPRGRLVCHECDNGLCVNPMHLFLGSHRDNTQDMIQKQRNVPPPLREGSAHPNSKLTEDMVREMRRMHADGLGASAIARRFGIRPTTASKIVLRKAWSHVA